MKDRILVISFINCLILFFIGCGQGNKDAEPKAQNLPVKQDVPKGVVNNKIVCQNDTSISYAAYLPTTYSSANKYPVILFLDAHARGKLPVSKYKSLAEKYGYILIGSNNSKNEVDWNALTNIFQVMLNDVLTKLSIDKSRIYTAGFSGGAKVAGIICALNPDIKGVIGCAAPFPLSNEMTQRSFDYIGFAGNEDFNYMGMKELDRSLDETSIRHKLVIFDGKHEWCPENVMEEAFKWFENPVTEKEAPETQEETTNEFKEKQMMEYYGSNIEKQNLSWWKKEVDKLNNEIKNSDKETALRDKRVLNYTSLMMYMHIKKVFNTEDAKKVEEYLEMYKLVDPTNPEHAYLSAELYAKQNKIDKAMNSLKEAVKLGFEDLERLQKDNSLKALKGSSDYKEIVDKLMMKQ